MSTDVVPAVPVTGNPVVSDAISDKLSSFGLNAEQIAKIKGLGAETAEDLLNLTESDLVSVGVPLLKARKLAASLKPVPTAATAPTTTATMSFDTVLPTVPDDASWLNSLRTGGVLKIEQSTVISAIRAALADRFGLYDIPKKLVTAIEEYIDVTEEQVSEEFWQLRKQLTRKSYGDLFQAIDGLDSSYVTDKRKTELLSRINTNLWPSIVAFNEALAGWQEAWMQGSANPVLMLNAIAAASGGGIGMPPGLMQPPDCGALRDAAEAVNDSLNRTFRGTGVQITAALAYEANQIKAMIENPRLPILCGVPSRDLLLKKLGVSVPATYPRMEQNLTRFVLGIMQTDKVAAGNDELQYFGTLFMLGTQIPWDDLRNTTTGTKRPRGIGANASEVVSANHSMMWRNEPK